MLGREIYNCAGLIEYIREIGFLPLLSSGIAGYSAEEVVTDDCRYVTFPDGGWDWPLWKWKGEIVREGGCVYVKFFDKKAGFVSREWWSDLCNLKRSVHPLSEDSTVEYEILQTLRENGSMITRDLRKACGFTGPKMRGRFDAYVTRLQMGCRVVTEDFVYPADRHGNEYGWGWSLLTTPEQLYGKDACQCSRTPMESYERIKCHLSKFLPFATEKKIKKLIE